MISVTIDSPNTDIGQQWDDLIRRASSNVFMNPAALQAASETDFAAIKVLLAWEQGAGQRKLVGVWRCSCANGRRSGRWCWKRCLTIMPFFPVPWSIRPA